MSWYRIILMIVVCVSCFVKCKCDDPNVKPKNDGNVASREKMLTYIADDIILPSYAKFKVKADSLSLIVNAFTENPTNQNLINLRSVWVNAYTEWQKVELFDVGPANRFALRNFVNIYPCDPQKIKANILDTLSSLEISSSYTAQGFPSLDYLINGLASTDDSIVTFYSSDLNANKRRKYLKKVTTQLSNKFNETYTAWTTTYRSQFVSNTTLSAGSSTSTFVNGFVLNYEKFIRAGKFSIPSGAIFGTTFPEKVEAFYKKDLSKTLASAAHQASLDLFTGKSVKNGTIGYSLQQYLDEIGANDQASGKKLSEIIIAQMNKAQTSINGLDNNFYNLVKTDNQKLIATFNELQATVKLIKVDMTSAMSISITYTDNDGD